MNLTGNQQMGLGALILTAVVALSTVTGRAKAKGVIQGAWSMLMRFFPDPAPESSPVPSSISEPIDIHKISQMLMEYFQKEQDEEGIMLAGSIGQHVYKRTISQCRKKTQPVTAVDPGDMPVNTLTPVGPGSTLAGMSNEQLAS